MNRLKIVALAGLAWLVGLAVPAQAYDNNDCTNVYGQNGVFDFDTLRIDTGTNGMVDFGDHPHWFGAPQGTAVVCFSKNSSEGRGKAFVKGQLFADSAAITYTPTLPSLTGRFPSSR